MPADADEASPARTRKRQYGLALALMVAGSALGWWAVSSSWVTVEESLLGTTGNALGNTDIAATSLRGISGATLSPLASAMPILGAAGIAGIIGSRGVLRRVIGALVLAAGLVLAWSAFTAWQASSIGTELPRYGEVVATSAVYPLLAIVAGILLAAGGGLAVARGATWAALGKGYERPGRSPRDAWESLDMGVDPTIDDE